MSEQGDDQGRTRIARVTDQSFQMTETALDAIEREIGRRLSTKGRRRSLEDLSALVGLAAKAQRAVAGLLRETRAIGRETRLRPPSLTDDERGEAIASLVRKLPAELRRRHRIRVEGEED